MLQLIQCRLQLFYPVQHKNQHFHIPGLTPSDSLSLFPSISIALCRTKKKGCGAYDCPVLDAWWDNSFSFPWWCGIDDESMRIMCEGLIHAVKDLRG